MRPCSVGAQVGVGVGAARNMTARREALTSLLASRGHVLVVSARGNSWPRTGALDFTYRTRESYDGWRCRSSPHPLIGGRRSSATRLSHDRLRRHISDHLRSPQSTARLRSNSSPKHRYDRSTKPRTSRSKAILQTKRTSSLACLTRTQILLSVTADYFLPSTTQATSPRDAHAPHSDARTVARDAVSHGLALRSDWRGGLRRACHARLGHGHNCTARRIDAMGAAQRFGITAGGLRAVAC
ncbi:MAG: hypothetical protein ACI9KS_001850, partial [Sulfitobacter sp.]